MGGASRGVEGGGLILTIRLEPSDPSLNWAQAQVGRSLQFLFLTNLLVEDVRAPLSLKPWLTTTPRHHRAVLARVRGREQ